MAAVQRDQTPIPFAVQECGFGPSLRKQTAIPPAVQERGAIPGGASGAKGGVEFARFNQGLATP